MKKPSTGRVVNKPAKNGSNPAINEDGGARSGRADFPMQRQPGVARGNSARLNEKVEADQTAINTVLRDFAVRTIQAGVAGLVREFNFLRVETGRPPLAMTAFTANPDRNRYKDVFCQDETRVVLKWPPGSTNDYIHANWASIRGEKRFICSQGPTENTIDDFWRMIWEQKIRVIVMLCNVVEQGKKKCEQYYPEKPEDPPIITASNIIIKNTGRTEVEKLHTVSSLDVTVNGETFSVRHYFWSNWPDRGVPSDIMVCLRLLARIKAFSPILVHCSAGIGRTGTIVGLEMCLQLILSGEPLSMQNVVRHLRACRHGSVQTDVQYLYMHRVMMGLAENKKLIKPEEFGPFYETYEAFLKSRGC